MIALWLGHEKTDTVQIYLHANLALKERALARTAPLGANPDDTSRPTRYSPFWRHCDYAEPAGTNPIPSNLSRPGLDIIRHSGTIR